MTSPDIFLSYSREDQATARRFAESFEREGFKVWWDATLRSGEAYDEVTESALREAKAVVVLWSKKSVVSRWVRAEATLADRNRTLVPAMIEPCERPIMFELTQTADLSKWGGGAGDSAWLAFLIDVRLLIGVNATESATFPQSVAVHGQVTQDGRPSLAILPFTNRSGERADDVFADGMVEDLISALSYSSGLKVIAQSATAMYRRNVSDLRSIGRDLGVRYVLEGNVRRIGQGLRVTAQLVEAESAKILWTQRFERPLSELAALQEQLVVELAGHLNVQVERLEIERALKKPEELTAWEAVMRAMASASRPGPGPGENLQTAIDESRRAVHIAPDFALGHATLAYSLASIVFNSGGKADPTWLPEASTEARRALSLDNADPAVLTRVAWAMGLCGQWNEALVLARRALDLNPNNALCRETIAALCIRHGRPEEALEHLDAELVLAPRSYRAHLNSAFRALAHFQAGRYDLALQAVEHSLSLFPDFVFVWKDKTIYLEALGRRDEAREAIRRLRATGPRWTLADIISNVDASFIAPETAAEMNAIFRKVWNETPTTT